MAHFEHPAYLLLALACVPAGFLFFTRFGRLCRNLLPLLPRDQRQTGTSLSRALVTRFVLFAVSWILLVCAAASPRWGTEFVATRQAGSSIMFVMDISRSMGVKDVVPYRLAYAARYANSLIERLDNTPCGVVLVKGSAVLALPLTTDRRTVLDLLSVISSSMLTSPGSAPGRGIMTALASFPANSASARCIILFTDGDETDSSLAEAARAVRVDGAHLIIVGVGTTAGGEIDIYPDPGKTEMRISLLREDLLKKTAHDAGSDGLYVFALETGSAFRVLEKAIPSTKDVKKIGYLPKPVYRYFEFLLASLLCMCAGYVAGGLAWKRN